jgi:metal-sulfur cluster biosynthetic enzyme
MPTASSAGSGDNTAAWLFYTIGMSFSAGDPLISEVESILSTVDDPELGLDIVSLGLVYAIERKGDGLRIVYSLTSMGCPLGPMIEREMREALADLEGIDPIETELVFDPPWSPEKMSDEAKFLLGVYGRGERR